MKILHITPYYKPFYNYGGPVVSVSGLCESLVSIGHEVVVATTFPKDGRDHSNLPRSINGVKILYFQNAVGGNIFFSPALLRWLWKNMALFPLVHVHTWWDLVAVLSLFMLKLRNRVSVFSPRGMLSSYSFEHRNQILKRLFNNLFGRFLFRNTVLHATSRQEQAECLSIYTHWQSVVLPNFVELPEVFRRYQSSSTLEIIFLSRIDAKKGLPLLFEALSGISFDFVLKIAGEGDAQYIEYLREAAREFAIQDKVEWLGWLKGEQKFEALSRADIFVLTSYNENFANVIVEALSVGTAVVVTKGVGLSDYINENDLGWVADHTAEDIRNVLVKAFENGDKRERVRVEASKQVRRDFSGNELAKAYLHAYQNILNNAN